MHDKTGAGSHPQRLKRQRIQSALRGHKTLAARSFIYLARGCLCVTVLHKSTSWPGMPRSRIAMSGSVALPGAVRVMDRQREAGMRRKA